MKITPRHARYYIFYGVLLMALPFMLSNYKGHTGKLLVATNVVRGTPFERTVIYLDRHDFWGAHGFIINQPLETEQSDNMPKDLQKRSLYYGGPVGFITNNFLLIEDPTLGENGFVFANLADLESQVPKLMKRFEETKKSETLRAFSGYSGWGIMQLNQELARGGWAVLDYDPVLMFHTSTENIWDKAVARTLEGKNILGGGA